MYPRIAGLRTVDALRQAVAEFGDLPIDSEPLAATEQSPLAQPLAIRNAAGTVVRTLANRWCIQPMEGWDATPEGRPSEWTLRRWSHFGESGAAWLWGGEAVAVRPDGRANPRQLCFRPDQPFSDNVVFLRQLRETAVSAHRNDFGDESATHLLIGLQLTHSGRFSKPTDQTRYQPRVAFHHPLLDARVGIAATDDSPILTDGEIRQLISDYVPAARAAAEAGFDFVDVKACHGYLAHEFLSARTRPGPYGGDFEGRSRYLREIIAAIRNEVPQLLIGVRLSLFDGPPFRKPTNPADPGIPEHVPHDFVGFGCRTDDPSQIDLAEPIALLTRLRDEYGVRLFNLSAGSPYYNPHLLRPAYFPPSDGYHPPENPLAGCVRQIHAVRDLKVAVSDITVVGSAYSYFQEYLPHVAQAVVRAGWVDAVGIGRLVLSDWRFPAKILKGQDYRADKLLCRTFSDCTTAPRNGLISGCYPLDPAYKKLPEAHTMREIKANLK